MRLLIEWPMGRMRVDPVVSAMLSHWHEGLTIEQIVMRSGVSMSSVRRILHWLRPDDGPPLVSFDKRSGPSLWRLGVPSGAPSDVTVADLVECGLCSPELAHILVCQVLGCQEDQP